MIVRSHLHFFFALFVFGCSNPLGEDSIVDGNPSENLMISEIQDQNLTENQPSNTIMFDVDNLLASQSCSQEVIVQIADPLVLTAANLSISGTAPNCELTITPINNTMGSTSIEISINHNGSSASTNFIVNIQRQLTLNGSSFEYTNQTHESNCLMYLRSSYYQSQGDATYWIDPDGPGNLAPFEAYCDMTTDGGGWTLIGRGRQGWSWSNDGVTPNLVHTSVGTTSAFTPSYYSASTVDGIALNIDFQSLQDGFRIKRALDPTGSSYQEVRWEFTSMTNFSWLFTSSIALNNISIDGTDFGSGNTRDTYVSGNNQTRVFTWDWSGHNYQMGFSYGSSMSQGENNATNFLWENSNESHAIPYTEVYLRE